jgi:hypothetical protein
MPLINPEPRYFSIPSSVSGGNDLMKCALNCLPWFLSLYQIPLHLIYSPTSADGTLPVTVIKSL